MTAGARVKFVNGEQKYTVLFPVLFGLLALSTYTIWYPQQWVLLGIEACVMALAAAFVLHGVFGDRQARLGTGAIWLAAATAWIAMLTLAGWSVYRFDSENATMQWAVVFAVYLMGCQLFTEERVRSRFKDWFLWFGSVTAVIAVTQYFTSEGRFLWLFDSGFPDLLGPFQNRNNFAAFVELLVPLALWQSIRKTRNNWLWLAVTAVLVAAVVASTSRAGTAIVFGELLAVLVLAWRQKRVTAAKSSRYAAVLAGLILTTTLVVGWEALLNRVWGTNPILHRPEIMGSTLSMVAARPWTGFGPGTFQTIYPAFARFDIGQVVNHAHNDWLEWATEGGVPLLLIMVMFAGWHVKPALNSVWGVGILAVFLHALVDYPLQRLGVAGWVFLMLAAVAAERNRRSSTPAGSTRWSRCGARLPGIEVPPKQEPESHTTGDPPSVGDHVPYLERPAPKFLEKLQSDPETDGSDQLNRCGIHAIMARRDTCKYRVRREVKYLVVHGQLGQHTHGGGGSG